MFTRLKTLSLFLIFCLSFLLAVVSFGEEGLLVRKTLKAERDYAQQLLLEKEAEVTLLRGRNEAEKEEPDYEKDFIYSFGEGEVYEPEKIQPQQMSAAFQGFDLFHCVLLALVPVGILAAIFLVQWILEDIRLERLEKKEEKEDRHYGRYDD